MPAGSFCSIVRHGSNLKIPTITYRKLNNGNNGKSPFPLLCHTDVNSGLR